MEQSIVLIHAGLAVIFILYLLIRLLFSLFGLRSSDYQRRMRSKFRIADWTFVTGIALSGMYPIIILGEIELYHVVKMLLLLLVVLVSRYATNLSFALASLVAIGLSGYATYASLVDEPVFPKEQGTFESAYPEIAGMGEIGKGERIFTVMCVQCHGNDGRKGRFGAADLTISTLSLQEKVEIVTKGSPLTVMRSFSHELSEKEIVAVAKYVDQLSR